MDAKTRFLQADNEEIERSFLDGRKITDLPVYVDAARVPGQGRIELHRTVNVERESEGFLVRAKAARETMRPLWQRVFDRLVFG